MNHRLIVALTLFVASSAWMADRALAIDVPGCGPNASVTVFMQGDTHLSTNNTSHSTAQQSASLACSQQWSWYSNLVTPVGAWWADVQAGYTTWIFWCRVCTTGGIPPLPADTFETPVSLDDAVNLVEGHYAGKVTGIELVQLDPSATCSEEAAPQTPTYTVTVVEDDIMKQVLVNARTGEITSSFE